MGRIKRRGGRRRLSEHDRTVLLGVAVTTSMKAAVDKAADDRGMSSSMFVRILIRRFFEAERAKAAEKAVETERIAQRRENNWWPISRPRPVAGGAR